MRKITVPDEGAESLFGTYDENLKHLEGLFSVRIRTNGHEVIVEGEAGDVARTEKVLDQLAVLLRGGYKLGKGDVKTAATWTPSTSTTSCSASAPPARARRIWRWLRPWHF
jgi:phosphate starvation-inducible protein PhoH